MAQQFNAGHYAILAKRKAPDAMITGRAEPARALIALNNRRVFSMVATVHHLKTLNSSPFVMAVAIRLRAGSLMLLIRLLLRRWRWNALFRRNRVDFA